MSTDEWILILALIAFCVLITGYGVRSYCEWQKNRLAAMQNVAVGLFIEHGKVTQAFHTVDMRTTKAAIRERERRVKEKVKEAKRIGFKSFCECPRCGAEDIHFLNEKATGRVCNDCGFEWEQK